jgi:site-specific DNA-cytosine methylase
MYRFVSCQTFAGGFDTGMVQAGFEFVHKVEQKGGFGMANCLANRHILGEKWTHQSCAPDDWYAPSDVPVVSAHPPCNACMWALVDYTARVKPEIVIMESVRQAFSGGRDLMLALRTKLEEKSGLRYNLHHVMHDAIEVGGAAVRKRYFWVASRIPFGVDFPKVRQPTLAEVIGDLEGLETTWECQPYRRPASWWSAGARSEIGATDGHMTRSGTGQRRALDLLNLAEDIDEGWPEGAHIAQIVKKLHEKHDKLPDSWGADYVKKIIENDYHMGFISVSRWKPRGNARVITGGALDLVLHPWLPRFITHREAARIMGFPDDWSIRPLRHNSNLRMTWGKGITVQCGKWIGEHVARALDGDPSPIAGKLIGDREWLIKP